MIDRPSTSPRALLWMCAAALAAFGLPARAETARPCLSDQTLYLGALASHLSRFQTEMKRASKTSRVALNVEVGALRRLRGETARLRPPPCASRLSRHVLDAMDVEVRTLRRFLAMSDAELAAWDQAPESDKRRMLRRSESEQAWRLVAFELRILRQQPALLPPDAR